MVSPINKKVYIYKPTENFFLATIIWNEIRTTYENVTPVSRIVTNFMEVVNKYVSHLNGWVPIKPKERVSPKTNELN